ncbi:MAG: SDR family oxidoreductase [Bdellovibrio sp.]|nr:SDR family oxidoreductase [Bdellovibrio sp.]
MKDRFFEKTALITGAAQGIGVSIVKRLSQEGATVCLLDINKDLLEKIKQEIEDAKGEVQIYRADVTNKEEVNKTVNEILRTYKKIDILVNNAGIIRDGFVSKISEEDWDQVLSVNLKGSFLLCQAVFPSMKEKRYGKIINISSRAWLGNIGQANYSASKGGLVSLTRTLALEFARYNINVNAVAPGLIDTPMARGLPKEALERLIKMQPTGKMGCVDDIASAVAFLASDEAQFITGQILHVDGGKSCGLLAL